MSNLTAPLKIGTQYIQAAGVSGVHYVIGMVVLHEATGLSVSPDHEYDEETNTINYTYTYNEADPVEGANKACYLLSVFLPEGLPIPTPANPLKICVTNTKNSNDTKTGTVITSNPIIKPATQPNSMQTDTDPRPEEDVPRWLILNYWVSNGDESTPYYFIFLIAKTNENNNRLFQLSFEGKTLACGYIPLPDQYQVDDPAPSAAVAYISSSEAGQFDTVSLMDNTASISYSDPKPTKFNLIS